MMEKKREVVVAISSVGELESHDQDHDHGLKVFESYEKELASKSTHLNCASPEIRFTRSPNTPPQVPATNENLTARKTLLRSVYSKPKSRFVEQSYPIDETLLEENVTCSNSQEQSAVTSPYRNSYSPRTPLMASPGSSSGEDPDEIIYRQVEFSKAQHKRLATKALIKLFMFVCVVGILLASLTVEELRRIHIWSLGLWRWGMLVMVTFFGLLVTKWFMHIVVFLIEMNFLLKKKVLYFVHGLKQCVQVFIWISLVLLTWVLFINHEVQRSKLAARFLNDVTWTLVSLLIGAFLWVIKTLLLSILASNFHVKSFFDRIQESIFHQYVLQTLSGPPLMEEDGKIGRSQSIGRFSFGSSTVKGGTEKEVIDMAKLHKMKQEKVSAWTMKILVDAVMNSRLSTISNSLDESFYDVKNERTGKAITNEMEATAAAYYVFKNVAASPCCKDIDENELRRFMIKEEVPFVFSLLAQADTGLITKKSLADWVVMFICLLKSYHHHNEGLKSCFDYNVCIFQLKVYQECKALAHALCDTKTAVKQLNKVVTGVLVVVSIVVWLLLMEIATTKVLVFLSSQLVLAGFMFGNTCKNIFEAIIFVFVMHPFDVGDRCVVDGVELLVEEMNILTTVFLKLNNEKVYYPNYVLATKPISNYYRSPNMVESIEFSVDFMTPAEKIGATMNFQEFGEKLNRRSELVMEVKRIFEELNIRYSLLPQGVHLRYIEPDTSSLK